MKTRVERINPYLNVKNISESVKHYVKILGFYLYFESPDMGIVEQDGHQIHLIKSSQKTMPSQIWIGVEKLEPFFKQYQENGARIAQTPTNYSWAYQMVVEDIDGNKLIIGSAPKADEPYQDKEE